MNKTPKNNVRPSFLLPFSIREIAKPSATANRSRHSLSALRTVARPQQSPRLCALAAVHPFVPIALPPLPFGARVRPAALIPAGAAAMRYMYSDSHTLTVFPLHPSSPHPPDQPQVLLANGSPPPPPPPPFVDVRIGIGGGCARVAPCFGGGVSIV